MEKEKHIFVGNATKRDGNYGEYYTGSINIAELAKHDNGKWYAKIKMQLRREPWKYGETHSIVIDTYKPQPKVTPIDNFPF